VKELASVMADQLPASPSPTPPEDGLSVSSVSPQTSPELPATPAPADTSSDQTSADPPPPPKKTWAWIIIIILLVVGIVIAGFALYSSFFSTTSESTPVATESTPSPTSAPSATPQPTPDRSRIKIQVLNGSGIPGKAGEVASALEALGYSDVATGNADAYDYDQTEISVAADADAVFTQLVADLKSELTISEESGVLPQDSQYTAVIVVGRQ